MEKVRMISRIVVSIFICIIFLEVSVSGVLIQKPVIYSFYWPIVKGPEQNMLIWNMETPTIIDVPPHEDNLKWLEAREYWEKKGKIVLNRVNPFKGIENENDMYKLFDQNMKKSRGIGISEITSKVTKKQAEMFINVLKRIRQVYPEKIIAVWWAGDWNAKNAYILNAIKDYADMYIPELYVSQSVAARRGFGRFRSHIETAEMFVPDITKKTVIGIGMHPKMADDPTRNFGDHLSAQIKLLGTDPIFKNILGIALFTPVDLTVEDQKRIDHDLKRYFGR